MRHHPASDTIQALHTHILQCSIALQEVQQTAVKQQWHVLGRDIASYEAEITRLRHILQHINNIPKACLASLQHLHYNQRRVMRLIHQAQTKTKESISAANKAITQASYLTSSDGDVWPVLDSR